MKECDLCNGDLQPREEGEAAILCDVCAQKIAGGVWNAAVLEIRNVLYTERQAQHAKHVEQEKRFIAAHKADVLAMKIDGLISALLPFARYAETLNFEVPSILNKPLLSATNGEVCDITPADFHRALLMIRKSE